MILPGRLMRVVVGLLVLVGCSPTSDTRSSGADELRSPTRPAGSLVRAEWTSNITHRVRGVAPPLSLRAGGGLIASMHEAPTTSWVFELAGGALLAGGPHNPGAEAQRAVQLREPVDLVRIAPDGFVWHLDRATGRVIGEDIGGRRAVIASLGVREAVRTACALGDSSIAYLDDARPGRLMVHHIASRRTRVLVLTEFLTDSIAVPWEHLRFGGSMDGPCVLSAPDLAGVFIVSDTVLFAPPAFVSPQAVEPGRRASSGWRQFLGRLLGREAGIEPVFAGALDATSFPGGVAVLVADETSARRRLVDVYTSDGSYVMTMRLPRRAWRIAGTRHRLLAWGVTPDSVFLSSYALPARLRDAPVVDPPSVVAPAPTASLLPIPEDDPPR